MKLVSGGQTGADRGALEAALEAKSSYGGWVPLGRMAEDGRVPDCFTKLQETRSREYTPRTWQNVRDSDGTVIFYRTPMEGGSKLTASYCRQQDKPFLMISSDMALDREADPSGLILAFVRRHGIQTLNVAGSRESKVKGLQGAVKRIMLSVLEGKNSCRT